jgi:hypothetical protein
LSRLPSLDDACGKHFIYRDFIECGDAWTNNPVDNVPRQPETYASLTRLATEVLDPVIERFGDIELTYGFSGAELLKHVKQGIAPKIDQHAAQELSSRGSTICTRGGAACDFFSTQLDSLRLAQWIVSNTNFDRLYYYGPRRPIHVSAAIEPKRQIVSVKRDKNSRSVRPSVVSEATFLTMNLTNGDEQS